MTATGIGIDLGGSKIEGIVLQAQRTLARRRIETPAGDYAATVDAVAGLVSALEQTVGMHALPVGIGHPGSIAPGSGLLRNANSTCLNGRPFRSDLAEALGARPLRLANDANCLALSEAHDGAAADVDSAFLVILGTGVGGALSWRGEVIEGANGLGGEWGHNPLPWPTDAERAIAPCWCGRQGCIETWLSGPALMRDHEENAGAAGSPEQIVMRSADGDPAARASLERYAGRLARSLATVINIFDPQRIVLAGGLSAIECLYTEVPRRWLPWIFAESASTELVPAAHGSASGVFGAARLGMADVARNKE